MLQSFSDANTPRRTHVIPKWSFISIQAIGGPVRIASSKWELDQSAINGALDGLQLNPSPDNTNVFQTWWIGELWIQPLNAGTQCLIIVPGYGHNQI